MAASDKKVQPYTSFNAGEYSPELAGRVDLESFGSSSRFMSNFMSQVSGGIKKFYGTTHVAEVTPEAGRNVVKFVPFINKYEPMVLVFWGQNRTEPDIGDSISVGLIYGDEYKPLDIKFPSSIDVTEMRWQQINDVIIFVHKTVQPLAIKFYGLDDDNEYVFVTENISFTEIPYFPIGTTTDYVGSLEASGISGTITLSIPSSVGNVVLPFPDPLDYSSTYSRTKTWWNFESHNYVSGDTIVKLKRKRNNVETTLVSGVCNTVTLQP